MRKTPYQYGKTGEMLLHYNKIFFDYVYLYLHNCFLTYSLQDIDDGVLHNNKMLKNLNIN